MYTLAQIAAFVSVPGPVQGQRQIRHLLTDSRQLFEPEYTLFFALRTASNNGENYVETLYHQGVRAFVVSTHFVAPPTCTEAVFLHVPHALEALQQVAAAHRKLQPAQVVGITGSNGKTTVKEWLFQMLSPGMWVSRSPRSYNSQLGVALSLWQMQPVHKLALIEAGISLPGEMQRLQAMIQPAIGILTSLGDAHSAGFASMEEKLAEKCLLFAHCHWLIAHESDFAFTGSTAQAWLAQRLGPGCSLLIIGHSAGHWLQCVAQHTVGSSTSMHLRSGQTEYRLTIPFTDAASIQNALSCIAFLIHLSFSEEKIQAGLLLLKPLEMRLQMQQGLYGITLINDSYSNDLISLEIALQYLHSQASTARKVLVLSPIVQSELAPPVLYARVAAMLSRWPVDQLFWVGPAAEGQLLQTLLANTSLMLFEATEQLKLHVDAAALSQAFVLLKGARRYQFEMLVQAWQQRTHQTVLEVHLGAMAHNLRFYRSLLQPGTKIMAMVKAYGYGSGGAEVARMLAMQQTHYLAVAYADEAIDLRMGGVQLPMMVLNVEPSVFGSLITHRLEPEIFSLELLEQWIAFQQQQGIEHHPIHLKIDTGMHRLGFGPSDFAALENLLAAHPELYVKSVFSHFAASEDAAETAFTHQQYQLFTDCTERLQKVVGPGFLRHISNSGGIGLHPAFQLDMIRLGIGLYGVDSSGLYQHELQPVMAFYTTVSQVRALKAGETVGYNRRGLLKKDSIIATLRAGYADGYDRRLGNGVGHVLIHGQPAKVVGSVCMDMIMVDVTDVHPAVRPGDRAELFGPQLPVQQLAQWCGTIAYELLTGIAQRVQRLYIKE